MTPSFAHASEAEMARILDFYDVRWVYEPHTFPILWNLEGEVVESFSPDFWLPDLDCYLEMTTLRQKLVRKKNRKLRRLRELYPAVTIKLFYARDFRALMLKYGKLAAGRRALGQLRPDDPAARLGATPPPSASRPPLRSRSRSWPSPFAAPPRPARRASVGGDPMTHEIDLHEDIGEVLLTEEQIQGKVRELGARISADYRGRQLTLVSVLKGSLPFMADLMRAIDIPVRIDLMEVSSYGGTATESSGLVRILKDLSASIDDEDVLIVEDIIDTGLTLNYLIRYLRGKNPASLRICTLLDKPARRLVEIPVDYTGFIIPDRFVVGYGLDYGELYRNLRVVGVLRPGGLHRGRAGVTMHRRPLGRGRTPRRDRRACSLVVGCVLPWWMVGGGDTGIPAMSGNGFEGAGIVVFLVGDHRARARRAAIRGGRPAARRRPLDLVPHPERGRLDRVRDQPHPAACSPVRSRSASRRRSSPTGRACGSRRSGSIVLSRATYDMAREPSRR